MDPVVNRRARRWIPVSSPQLGPTEEVGLAECVRRNWISCGPECAAFEREFATAHGKAYGVACTSGTVALKLALALHDIGPGDTVLVPAHTMVAVANAVLYRGAIPRFVDSNEDFTGLDVNHLDSQLRSHKPAAVIVAHLYGNPDDDAVKLVCDNDVVLIEDCAEAHYARFADGRPVGSDADAATFSFYANKIIATGEGGMVLVDDAKLAEKLDALRSHAFTPGNHFHHQFLAYGERMTDLQATVGRAQHARKDEFIRRRDAIANRYDLRLEHVFASGRLRSWYVGPNGVWWVYPVIAESKIERDGLRVRLADCGVETRTFFYPLHLQPHLAKYAEGRFPNAENAGECGLYMPLHAGMTDEEVDYICDLVTEYCS